MNQTLKSRVYGKGTQEQVDFIAKKGGMNEEEKTMFQMFHDGKSDLYIQNTMNLSPAAMADIEHEVSSKLCLALFYCINKIIYLEGNFEKK